MTLLTITSKGQITLRRELLQFIGITPGQQVNVHKLSCGMLALEAVAPQDSRLLLAVCGHPGKR